MAIKYWCVYLISSGETTDPQCHRSVDVDPKSSSARTVSRRAMSELLNSVQARHVSEVKILVNIAQTFGRTYLNVVSEKHRSD